MATPLKNIEDILNLLKSQANVFADLTIPTAMCSLGLIQAGMSLEKEFVVYDETVGDITSKYIENISNSEVYLSALYAYRTYALQKHDEFASKAVGVKTISFAVTGLIDRARQTLKVVNWCDTEIANSLAVLRPASGYSTEMSGGM